ncbi:LacI family DNA-binding transcriptional regulator [Halalkalibacter oceani]|uniref:LacI family DNA-binding transcriptional regulator n=1 Tax=Halalkalibacter oceani TaxID=1653776 RepID=UPI003398C5D1
MNAGTNEKGRATIATRKDVAKMAGVSEATVSRVFSEQDAVKEHTKQKVLAAAKSLNYYPNVMAKNFAKRKSGNIGVILPYLPKVKLFSVYYFSEILNGIGEAIEKEGYDMLLLFQRVGQPYDYKKYFLSHKIDAAIILGAKDSPEERDSLRELRDADFPFCLVNQHFDGEQFCEIDAEHVAGSYAAVTHLIEQGCQNIAFLNGPLAYSNSLDRLKGYQKALQDHGLSGQEQAVFYGQYSLTSGYKVADDLLSGQLYDGIAVANDRMAIGLMQRMKELGIKPGADIAVVGYDDSDASAMCDPALSSVHVPFFEMGKRSVQRLVNQLAAPHMKLFQEKLETRLLIRESSQRNQVK